MKSTKHMQNLLETDIDFILNGRDVSKQIANKVMEIMLPKITIFSHRNIKSRNNLTGISAHLIRKSIRQDLSSHVKSYLKELNKKRRKNEDTIFNRHKESSCRCAR